MANNMDAINEANSPSVNHSKYAITTVDNPYDPFTQFTDWLLFDNLKGYGTCQYLARIARVSDLMSEFDREEEIGRAIDEIVYFNPDLYKKVINKNYVSSYY